MIPASSPIHIPVSPLWERPERFLCEDFKTIPQKLISSTAGNLLLRVTNIACRALVFAPGVYILLTCTVTQVAIPFGALLVIAGFLTEKDKDMSYAFLKSLIQSPLKACAVKIINCCIIAVIFLPIPMVFYNPLPLVILGLILYNLYRFSLFELFATSHENKTLSLLKKDLEGVLNENVPEDKMLVRNMHTLDQFDDFSSVLENFFKYEILPHLNEGDFHRFSITSKTVHNCLLNHPKWISQTTHFFKKKFRQKWIFRKNQMFEFDLQGKVANLKTNKALLAKNSVDLRGILQYELNSVKKLALSEPLQVLNAIEYSSPQDRSFIYLCLYKALLVKDIKKSFEIFLLISNPEHRELALLARRKFQWLRGDGNWDLYKLMEKDIVKRVNSEEFQRKENIFKRAKELVSLFGSDPKKFSKTVKKFDSEEDFKIYLNFITYQAYRYTKDTFVTLNDINSDLRNRAIARIAEIQALKNIPEALETLGLIVSSRNNLKEESLLTRPLIRIISRISMIHHDRLKLIYLSALRMSNASVETIKSFHQIMTFEF